METNPSNQSENQATDARSWLYNRWLISVVGIIILVLILMALHPVSKQQLPANQPKYAASVSITASGFVPQTISIKPGTVVTWTNNETANHEVAADPYPKDNSIPGFDSTVLLQKGDTYSFAFYNKGTYHVHDELNPLKLLETIVVK